MAGDAASNLVHRQFLRPLAAHFQRSVQTLRRYDTATFRGDFLAGLTVAVVAIPQSMAYAIIAGVPAVYGLYTLIFQCALGSLFNSHPLLSVGPINTQSLLVLSIVTRLADQSGDFYLTLVIALALFKGAIQLAMAAARLGTLVRYVSNSVVIGFTSGAGVLIAAGQVPAFLGVESASGTSTWPGLIGTAQQVLPALSSVHLPTVLLGVVSLALVIGGRMISPLAPGPLLAVGAAALLTFATGWGVEVIGALPQSLPTPRWPLAGLSIQDAEALLPGALALALLGLMEAYSIGKSLAQKTGDRVSANQELFSQGLTNFATSFLACIPGSGSFSRSALNHYAGGRTFLSGVINSLIVLGAFLAFAPAGRYIPMASIAAILFVVAYGLIDWRYFLRLTRANRADAIVCLGTFIATLTVPLAYAVFVGVFLNIALYLRRAGQLHLAEMVRTPAGPFIERPLRDRAGDQQVMFIQLEGDLFFAVADELQERLSDLANSNVRAVILRLKRTHSIDTTVLGVLEQFVDQMQAQGKHVLLCGVKPELMDRLRRYGLVARIGDKNVFETSFGVFTSAKQALRRAKELIGSSLDTEGVGEIDETEGWAYEI